MSWMVQSHVRSHQILFVALLISSACWVYSSSARKRLPDFREVRSELQQQPIQQSVQLEPFWFEYMENRYLVKPLALYEIWGLVVTHNNISSIADMYHDSSSVDFKDLCVIWGDNVSSNNFHRVHYYSEPWTCFYRPDTREANEQFSPNELSNNHILSRREEVRELIKDATVGDQIHMKGLLVSYGHEDHLQFMRTSSLVRNDTGNGACEVFFVEAAELLKEGNPFWKKVFAVSRGLSLTLLFLFPLSWFWSTQYDFQKLKKAANRKPRQKVDSS